VWDFDGQEIFKRAVVGMAHASADVLARCGHTIDDVALVVPHQANLRIIEFVARKLGAPMERVFLTVQRYGNMSAATVPVALVEALEEGRVQPGSLLLTPAFGGGLTWCSHLIRWGERTTPLDTTDIDVPALTRSALEIVRAQRRAPRRVGLILLAARRRRFRWPRACGAPARSSGSRARRTATPAPSRRRTSSAAGRRRWAARR
jgi:3-oxoacyl-[acyl-carrier-protein] synthase-3